MQENVKLVSLSSKKEKESDKLLLSLVTRLQKEEKTFNDTHYNTEDDVINLLNGILERVIRAPITRIHQIDRALGVLLCHAIFGRKHYLKENESDNSMNTDMWSLCHDPLYALLLAAYVSESAAKFYESIKRDPEDFKEYHRYFEEEAYNLLDEIYKDNDTKLEFHVFAKDYERRFRAEIPRKPGIKQLPQRKSMPKQRLETSVELLAVAFRGNCMKFISHVACQEYIGLRWKSGKVADSFSLALQLTPVDIISNDSFESCSLSSVTTIVADDVKVLGFGNEALGYTQMESWCSPQTKFILYTIFLVLYLVIYARVMITKPLLLIERGKFDYFELTLLCYVWLTLVVQQLPVGYDAWKQRGRLYWWEDYQMSTWRMYIVILNIVFILLSFAPLYNTRALAFAVSEILFMITFVLSTVSSLRYLSIFSFFGSKIELLLQTARSIVKYMTLFLIFWVIYAVCYLSLTETLSSTNDSILWQVLQSGAFEILGESKDEDRVGNLSDCSDVSWRDVLTFEVIGVEDVRCFFRGTLIPPLLFFYMMTAAVMLVNIFTAMLSHEYERTVEYADRYSKFHKYGMLARFESKVILPRPLNLIYFIIRYIFEKCLCRAFCHFCNRSSYCPWLSYLEGRPWGSSPPGAIVNEVAATEIINRALKKREPNAFAAEVQKYTAGLPTGYGSDVNDAETVLNHILKLYKEFMKGQTQQTRERVATMLDMACDDPQPIGDRPSSGIMFV